MTHPAGSDIGVTKAAVWYGPEVEGALSIAKKATAFVDRIPDSPEVLLCLENKIKWHEIKHIFLTENFDAWDWFAETILPTFRGLVTIGCYSAQVEHRLRLPFIHRCGLMVRVDLAAPWINQLRPHDQISVGVPYDLVTWTVGDGFVSKPTDYQEDTLR